jgi:site-specific recombinase XerD
LIKLGYKITDIYSLKLKHIQAVVNFWQEKKLNNASIKNRLSAIRKLADLIKKSHLVPSNNDLSIGKRSYVSEKNRALFNPDFSNITDKYIKVSLELQRIFGLRREESLKIKPHLADKENTLQLQPSWCKGGRGRNIPIKTEEQRYWLEHSKAIAGKFGNSLIPENKNYIQQRYVYDKQVQQAGLKNLHGLRHAYAQTLYKEIAGFECPKNGGKPFKELNTEQKAKDHEARMIITTYLGHSRRQVVKNYCG